MDEARIKPKERDQLFQALRAGVVPRAGIRHVQVGRAREIQEVARDLDRIANDGTSFRIIVGAYGSGKTFFMNLTKSTAQEKRLVTASADLSPERRLHSTTGQARALLAEICRSLATRSKPEGNALEAILQRLIEAAKEKAQREGISFNSAVDALLEPIADLAGGYDAMQVIRQYAAADAEGKSEIKEAALRWLRAEFTTKSEARQLLQIREIPDDKQFWDHLKIIACICRAAGYAGLLICLDELVNLYKNIQSRQARDANYEEILRILNDLLQGSAEGIGVMLGGTPEFLMDGRRGLYSYEALRSRLVENSFQSGDLVDLSGPVIRLQNLTPEDMWVLLGRLRAAWNSDPTIGAPLPDDAIKAFMEHCRAKIGAAYFQTPRATIRAFVDLLEILRQNPQATWAGILTGLKVERDPGADQAQVPAPQVSAPEAPASQSIAPARMAPAAKPPVAVQPSFELEDAAELELELDEKPVVAPVPPALALAAMPAATETPPASMQGQPEKGEPAEENRDDDLTSFRF